MATSRPRRTARWNWPPVSTSRWWTTTTCCPSHALLAVVHELNRHPDADIIYSDEDEIDESGRRYDPYFKPDWNPELFCGQNFDQPPRCLSDRARAAGRRISRGPRGQPGLRPGAARHRADRGRDKIRHIPHVLYHWRAIRGSAALGTREKVYAHDAARRAVEGHLARTGVAATCEPADNAVYHQRVRYGLPTRGRPSRSSFPPAIGPTSCRGASAA